QRARLVRRRAQIAEAQVRRDERDALLRAAANLAGPDRDRDVRDGVERDRPIRAGTHDQLRDALDGRALALVGSHEPVDSAVVARVARRDLAPHLPDSGAGDLVYAQAEPCGALVIETDLDLRIAVLGRRLDVREARRFLEQLRDSCGHALEIRELEAGDLDLERGR